MMSPAFLSLILGRTAAIPFKTPLMLTSIIPLVLVQVPQEAKRHHPALLMRTSTGFSYCFDNALGEANEFVHHITQAVRSLACALIASANSFSFSSRRAPRTTSKFPTVENGSTVGPILGQKLSNRLPDTTGGSCHDHLSLRLIAHQTMIDQMCEKSGFCPL
jgi:hypothetical protein